MSECIVEETENRNAEKVELLEKYGNTLVEEMNSFSQEVIDLIDEYLIKEDNPIDATVFYLKLKADFLRYLCIYGNDKEESCKKTKEIYTEAMNLANENLDHAKRQFLGVILNYSIFQYEVLGEHDDAIQLLEDTFNQTVVLLDGLTKDEFKESVMMLGLYKDNIKNWREQFTS